jgi:hypothetical protein
VSRLQSVHQGPVRGRGHVNHSLLSGWTDDLFSLELTQGIDSVVNILGATFQDGLQVTLDQLVRFRQLLYVLDYLLLDTSFLLSEGEQSRQKGILGALAVSHVVSIVVRFHCDAEMSLIKLTSPADVSPPSRQSRPQALGPWCQMLPPIGAVFRLCGLYSAIEVEVLVQDMKKVQVRRQFFEKREAGVE